MTFHNKYLSPVDICANHPARPSQRIHRKGRMCDLCSQWFPICPPLRLSALLLRSMCDVTQKSPRPVQSPPPCLSRVLLLILQSSVEAHASAALCSASMELKLLVCAPLSLPAERSPLWSRLVRVAVTLVVSLLLQISDGLKAGSMPFSRLHFSKQALTSVQYLLTERMTGSVES